MFKPVPAPNGYDNPKYAVSRDSMPRCLAYTGRSTDEPLYDAECLVNFLSESLTCGDDNDAAIGSWTGEREYMIRHGLELVLDLLRDKIALGRGELELPPSAGFGVPAPKLWTPNCEKGAQE